MKYLSFLKVLLVAALLGSAVASAGVSAPQPPKGKGEQCVEPTEEMRRNHMHYLMHQRDATMHEGIRTKRHSLKECINCHVVAGDDGKPVTFKSEEHFCNSCHSYASVKIDCFECHASTPSPGPQRSNQAASLFNSVIKAPSEK